MDDLEPIAGYPNKRTMLEELYVKELLSISEIAKRLGTGTATVVRWMQLLEIPRRSRGGDNTEAKIGWKLHRLDPRIVFSVPPRQLAEMVLASESYCWKFVKGAKATWNSQSLVR